MKAKKTKARARLAQLFSALSSLVQSGSAAGWMIIIGIGLVASIVLLTLLARFISPFNPSAIEVGPICSPPSLQFPFGTNALGQDMLSRTISGGAVVLQVPFLSVLVCLTLGLPIGLLSAYTGGFIDKITCLVMDSIRAFPSLILAIAVAAVLGRGVVNMSLSIAVAYIPSYFRIVRSQILTIKESSYVEAARAVGARRRAILLHYIWPNVISAVLVVATANFSDAILTAAGLTFIGLGVEVDVPDWGRDLTEGRALLPSGAWWVIVFPGIMIVLLALGFAFIGEGLSENSNPRLKR